MGKYDGRVYVEVTATTLPDGRISPRFIRWRDGRLLPVMKASGGPSGDGLGPGAKPSRIAASHYDFEVYVGTSTTPRHLYLDFEAEGMPRWYVKPDPAADDVPFSCDEPPVGAEREEPPTPRAAHGTRSLAGKCGIPLERDRIYVEPFYDEHRTIIGFDFPDGRKLRVRSQSLCNEYGREFFGNVCRHYRFALDGDRREWAEAWEEGRRWFLRVDFGRKSED